MKNILLLSSTAINFTFGLVFSLILLYSSPDNIVHSTESSLYSLGGAFFILVSMYSVSFSKEPNRFMKAIFVLYGVIFTKGYITLALMSMYAPVDNIPNSTAMYINLTAAGMSALGVISLFVTKAERVPSKKHFNTAIVIISLGIGLLLGINASYTTGSILDGSYYFLISVLISFATIFLYPLDTRQNSIWFLYAYILLFSLFSFVMALVSLYSSPDEIMHPLASALFFITSMISASIMVLDYKHLRLFDNLNNGPIIASLKVLIFTMPFIMGAIYAYKMML